MHGERSLGTIVALGWCICSQESPKGCSVMSFKFKDFGKGNSRVVSVPLVPAPQVREQGEGLAGGDADRHLNAEGEELVLLQRVHPHLGEHRARAGTHSATAEPPGCPRFGGEKHLGGMGQI